MGSVETILLAIGPILLAVSLHEAAHGMVANWLGDSTAKDLGRLTANPIKHIDPIGTIVVPLLLVVTVGMHLVGPNLCRLIHLTFIIH